MPQAARFRVAAALCLRLRKQKWEPARKPFPSARDIARDIGGMDVAEGISLPGGDPHAAVAPVVRVVQRLFRCSDQ